MEQEIARRIGVRLREERVKRGITLEQMAVHLGVRYQMVQKYERGYGLSAAKFVLATQFPRVPVSRLVPQARS